MTRYLNQDLVRSRLKGEIHQYGYSNSIVEHDDVDWSSRITIHKNVDEGKLMYVEEPSKEEIFISFPIAIDAYYINTSIKDATNRLADAYGIGRLICFEIFPVDSIRILEAYDVPLTKLSSRVAKIFGGGEVSHRSRVIPSTPDLRGKTYQKLNLGSLMGDRLYKIGEAFPHITPKIFNAKVDEHNQLLIMQYRGSKEKEAIRENSLLLVSQQEDRESRMSDLLALTKEYSELESKIDRINNELVELHISTRDDVLSGISLRDQRAFNNQNNDMIEFLRAYGSQEAAKKIDYIEVLQDGLIEVQIKITEIEATVEEMDQKIMSTQDAIKANMNNYDKLKVKADIDANVFIAE